MVLVFDNGTDEQKGWVNSAISVGAYDFDRITTTVHVSFGEPDTHPDDDFHDFAVTSWTLDPTTFDSCGRPDRALIVIKADLLDYLTTNPDGATPPHARHADMISGVHDVIYHELGHVVQAKFTAEQKAAICALYGASAGAWEADGAAWGSMVKEKDAETFKDVYLQDSRQWDNRAGKLDQTKYNAWLAVIDAICPCAGSGEIG